MLCVCVGVCVFGFVLSVVLLLADVEARFDMRRATDCGSLVD